MNISQLLAALIMVASVALLVVVVSVSLISNLVGEPLTYPYGAGTVSRSPESAGNGLPTRSPPLALPASGGGESCLLPGQDRVFLEPMARPRVMLNAMEVTENTGKEWSAIDLVDLRYSVERGLTVAEIACFLMRTDAEVREKAAQLGMEPFD